MFIYLLAAALVCLQVCINFLTPSTTPSALRVGWGMYRGPQFGTYAIFPSLKKPSFAVQCSALLLLVLKFPAYNNK
jgi:hypothetical protein